MALFPSSPYIGQVWSIAGRSWIWTGVGWALGDGQASDIVVPLVSVYNTPSNLSAAPPVTLNYV